jgi:hypothetical protein
MKFLLRMLSLITFGCMFLLGLGSNAFAGSSIPLAALAGTYTDTASAQQALCHDNLGNPIPCSTFVQGVDVLASFQVQALGEHTMDGKGNSCGSSTVVINDLPVDSNPPFAVTEISVGTLID